MASKRQNMFHKNKKQETTEIAPRWNTHTLYQLPFGPAKIIPRKVTDCEDHGTNQLRVPGTKLRKISRDTWSYSTDVILLMPVSDDIKVSFNAAYFGNGGWKGNWMMKDLGGICSACKLYIPQATKYVLKRLNLTDCPIPAGNYTVNDNIIKNPRFEIIPMIYNMYKLDLFFIKDDKRLGCKRIYFDIVPK
ncbi:hypothetical protein AAG570_003206 [Ranatra chinensis]|uniref:Uncharacterized protein n=1 Tax=Ranatra chinensis TaxID=642074 RepID=A0ABD0Y660_9HEMI